MEEIWKDVVGYEGLYQVSNMGRIRSLSHITKCGNYTRTTSGRILKQNPDLRGGLFSRLSIQIRKSEMLEST